MTAQSGCDPACSSGEVCQQVYNTNEQYECVSALSSSPVASPVALPPSPATADTSGCNPTCSADESCHQVFSSEQYECVANTRSPGIATFSSNVTSPLPASSSSSSSSSNNITVSSTGCNPTCLANEVCQQVLNSKQFECAPSSLSPAANAIPTPAAIQSVNGSRTTAPSMAASKAGLSGMGQCSGNQPVNKWTMTPLHDM